MTPGATLLPLVARALLHSLWQGAVAGAGLGLYQLTARRASSGARYAAACAALLLLPAGFVASLLGLQYGDFWKPAAGLAGPTAAVAAGWLERLAALPPVLLVGIWLTGVMVVGLYSLGGWVVVRRLLRRLEPVAEPVAEIWSQALATLRRRLGVRGEIEMGFSRGVTGPCAWGWLRPMVLVPVSWAAGMSPQQVEAVLAHELAHIARRDFLANGAQRCLETIFFYHPAVWWISRQVRQEREHCCDELAARVGGDRCGYARALLDLEQRRVSGWAIPLALPATGGSLRRRVLRLLNPTQAAGAGNLPRRAYAAAGGLAVVALLLTAVAAPWPGAARVESPAPRVVGPTVPMVAARRLPAAVLPSLRPQATQAIAVGPMAPPEELVMALPPAAEAPLARRAVIFMDPAPMPADLATAIGPVRSATIRVTFEYVAAQGCEVPRVLVDRIVTAPTADGDGVVRQELQALAPCGVTPQEVLRMLT